MYAITSSKVNNNGKCRSRVGTDAKTQKLFIRVTDYEKEKLMEVAEMKGVTLSNLIMTLVSNVYL